jgi:hypothetical protein
MDTDKEIFEATVVVLAGLAPSFRDKFIEHGLPHTHQDLVDAIGRAVLDTMWDSNRAVRAQWIGPLRLMVEAELRPKNQEQRCA